MKSKKFRNGGSGINRNDSIDGEREEDWMREFISNSPDPILKTGKEGTILYANKAGRSLLEVLKIQVGEKVPVEIFNTVRRVTLRKKPVKVELSGRREDILNHFYSPACR